MRGFEKRRSLLDSPRMISVRLEQLELEWITQQAKREKMYVTHYLRRLIRADKEKCEEQR